MRRTFLLLAGLVVVACAYWILRPWLSDDERAVRLRLEELAKTASVTRGEPMPARITRGVRIGAYFTREATLDLGSQFNQIKGRDTIIALAAKLPGPPNGVTIRFVDVKVWIGAGGQNATAYLTVTGSAVDSEGAQVVDARELDLSLQKLDGEWLIDRVQAINPIAPVR